MRTKSIKKFIVTGGLTAILAAGLVLPASASASSNTSNHFSYWKEYFNHISWNDIFKPITGGNQGSTGGTNGTPSDKPQTDKPQTDNNQSDTSGNSGSSGQTDTSTEQSQFASQVISLVNQERAKQGLEPLTSDAQLNNMAWAKAKDMSDNNYFSHTSPTYGSPFDMMKQFGISYRYAGENIAMGQKTPAEVVNAWMNSEGHRANILNPNFNLIGVGYYNGYWAQAFVGR